MAKDDKQSIAPTSEGTEYDDDGRIISAPIPPEMLELFREKQAEQAELDKLRRRFDQIEREERAATRALAQAPWLKPRPSAPTTPAATVSTKTWITAEAQRMRDANEVPAVKTAFAKMLGDRIARAHAQDPNIPLVGWHHIFNQLEDEWHLWPVTSIPST